MNCDLCKKEYPTLHAFFVKNEVFIKIKICALCFTKINT